MGAGNASVFRTERRPVKVGEFEAAVLEVVGDVDVTTAAEFRGAVLEALRHHSRPLIIDFRRCEFGDTSLVRPVADAIRIMRRRERRLAVVVCVQAPVRRMLEFAGLAPEIDVFRGEQQAIAALMKSSAPA